MGWLLALLMAVASPAVAAPEGWLHYTNEAYGYELDVPPGYVGRAEMASADGQLFEGDTSDITISAAPMTGRDLALQAAIERQNDEAAGWGLVFQMSTPRAASYGGKMGDRRLWVGLIAVCDGKGFARVAVTYGKDDAVKMQRPVSGMERSFRAAGRCSAL